MRLKKYQKPIPCSRFNCAGTQKSRVNILSPFLYFLLTHSRFTYVLCLFRTLQREFSILDHNIYVTVSIANALNKILFHFSHTHKENSLSSYLISLVYNVGDVFFFSKFPLFLQRQYSRDAKVFCAVNPRGENHVEVRMKYGNLKVLCLVQEFIIILWQPRHISTVCRRKYRRMYIFNMHIILKKVKYKLNHVWLNKFSFGKRQSSLNPRAFGNFQFPKYVFYRYISIF